MSKPVKELIRKELIKRFQGLTSLAVVDFTKVDAVTTTRIRSQLREKEIRVTVVKNALARSAFRELGLDGAAELLDGPCAVAYGGDSVVTIVRELLEINKEALNLTVKAALLDGEVFGADRIDELSRFPTRTEAIAKVIACVLGPGGGLIASVIGPGARLAGVVKAIGDKQEEPEAQVA